MGADSETIDELANNAFDKSPTISVEMDSVFTNISIASSPFNNEFGQGNMFVQLANHTLTTQTH